MLNYNLHFWSFIDMFVIKISSSINEKKTFENALYSVAVLKCIFLIEVAFQELRCRLSTLLAGENRILIFIIKVVSSTKYYYLLTIQGYFALVTFYNSCAWTVDISLHVSYFISDQRYHLYSTQYNLV